MVLSLGGLGLAWQHWHAVPAALLTARQGEMVRTLVATGHVESPHRLDLASNLTATVREVLVQEGQQVKAGERLIQLDDRELRAQQSQAESAAQGALYKIRQMDELQLPAAEQSVHQARIQLDNAQRQAERSRELFRQGFIGQAALDDAERTLVNAEAQWQVSRAQNRSVGELGSERGLAMATAEQAQSALAMARTRLSYATITAPVDALVITRQVEPGEQVQPGRALLTLSPLKAVQLVVQVDEKHLHRLQVGQVAQASADAYPDDRFDAVVRNILPSVNVQTGAVTVKLDVPRPPTYLRQDMTVSVDIAVERKASALTLPVHGVREAQGAHPWVMALRDGRLVRQDVRLGWLGSTQVEVLSGLTEGDQVLPLDSRLRAGRRVKPIELPASAPSAPDHGKRSR